jgi:hypothetical protein
LLEIEDGMNIQAAKVAKGRKEEGVSEFQSFGGADVV